VSLDADTAQKMACADAKALFASRYAVRGTFFEPAQVGPRRPGQDWGKDGYFNPQAAQRINFFGEHMNFGKRGCVSWAVWTALGAALLFGAETPFAKLLLSRTDPWMLAALFYLVSGLGLWRLRRMRRDEVVRPSRRKWFELWQQLRLVLGGASALGNDAHRSLFFGGPFFCRVIG